ncbi:hypothetical protein [Plantactinospora mayteni]|nr:hypothetical protein [Plantactinospora mayteni]
MLRSLGRANHLALILPSIAMAVLLSIRVHRGLRDPGPARSDELAQVG